MAKKTARPKSKRSSTKSASNEKPAARSSSIDQALRHQLLELLNGGRAHGTFAAGMGDWPVQLAGVKVANFPHTAWMLLEHMRLGQWDILEFSRNSKYASKKWPQEYWPATEAPANEKTWKASMAAFKKDLQAMEQLVANPKVDLYARIPWGDRQ